MDVAVTGNAALDDGAPKTDDSCTTSCHAVYLNRVP
jgi:hypothetical protein